MGTQGIKASREPDAVFENLPRRRRLTRAQSVPIAKLKWVHAQLVGQIVIEPFPGNRPLRRPETAERAGGGIVRVNRPRVNEDVGNPIRATAVNRDAIGDRRPPGRIGAGIEIGVHMISDQIPVRVGRRLGIRRHGMALGTGGHGFGATIDAANGSVQFPSRDGEQGLHGNVQLPTEAAPTCRWHDPNRLFLDPEHPGDLAQIHIGRLRTGDDLDTVVIFADPRSEEHTSELQSH